MSELEKGFSHCIEDLQDSLKVAEEIEDLLEDLQGGTEPGVWPGGQAA